jgi:hypothetical protein
LCACAFSKEYYASPLREHLLDQRIHSRDIAAMMAVNKDCADALAERAHYRPTGHLLLSDKDAIEL